MLRVILKNLGIQRKFRERSKLLGKLENSRNCAFCRAFIKGIFSQTFPLVDIYDKIKVI